MVTGPN